MKKFNALFLVFAILLIPVMALASPDNFFGVKYGSALDENKGLIHGFPYDSKTSGIYEKDAAVRLEFHNGPQTIGDLKLGSVYFYFDKDTKELDHIWGSVEFRDTVKTPVVKAQKQAPFKQEYFISQYPYQDLEKCYKELYSYFEKNFGEPSKTWDTKTGKGAEWQNFERKISITMGWHDISWDGIKVLDFIIQRQNYSPMDEIFL